MAPRSAARSRSTKIPGTSKKQYRQINRVRYDDSALAIADDADKISLPVAKSIYEDVQDGGVVTATGGGDEAGGMLPFVVGGAVRVGSAGG